MAFTREGGGGVHMSVKISFVNDQLVAYATWCLAVHLRNYVWSHHRALKAKVPCDFSSACSPDPNNVKFKHYLDKTQPGTK